MISFRCSDCNRPLRVKPDLAGKKVKCPGCGKVVAVPTSAPASAQTQAAPSGADDMPTVAPNMARPAPPDVTEQPTNPPPGVSDVTHDPSSPSPDHDSSLTDFLAPPQADDELGRLGGFRILKILGHGGMGVVFLGEDPHLGRKVAIKAMLPHLASSRTSQQRFLREAKAAAALEHDHIVPIFHVAEDRGAPFIVMPFLRGEPLDGRLKKERILPIADVLAIGRQVAEGLGFAHGMGLIHRDIKPANLWLEDRPTSPGSEATQVPGGSTKAGRRPPVRVKILDFGLARATTEHAGLTQSGAIVGTPTYMSPEQARGEKVDARCDLWSLGVVLYRMTTGELPFTGTDSVSTLVAIALNEAKPVRDVNPDIPEPLAALIHDLLRKDLTQRIGSAAEVVERLRELEAGEAASTAIRVGKAEKTGKSETTGIAMPGVATTEKAPKSRAKWIWPALGGVVALLLAVGVYFATRTSTPRPDDVVVDGRKDSAPTTPRFALRFDHHGTSWDSVQIPSLIVDLSGPSTVEGYVTCFGKKGLNYPFLANGLWGVQRVSESWNASVTAVNADGERIFASVNLIGPVKTPAGKRTHLALVSTGRQLRLFVDGKLSKQADVGEIIMENKKVYLTLAREFSGDMTEVRVSKAARYDKDFTPAPRHETDPDTRALYHMDEGEGNVLRDSSGNGHDGKIVGAKWVKVEDPPVASPARPFALQFDLGDIVECPNLQAKAKDFTLEGWFIAEHELLQNAPAAGFVVVKNQAALAFHGPGSWRLAIYNGLGGAVGGVQGVLAKKSQWTHVATVCQGGRVTVFVNGKIERQVSSFDVVPLGGQPFQLADKKVVGSMREIRISKVARYDEEFIPAQRFEPDADTLVLYHMDEGKDDVLKDSSGNELHGKIAGAKWVKVEEMSITPTRQGKFALSFDKNSRADLPESLKVDSNQSFTLEAYVTLRTSEYQSFLASSEHSSLGINKNGSNWSAFIGTEKKSLQVNSKEACTPGKKTHIAGVFTSTEGRLFVNGQLVRTLPRKDKSIGLNQKNYTLSNPIHPFEGLHHGVRISKVARYDKDFTPLQRFAIDKDTLALYLFDEGQGEVLNDSSGNGHHGKIIGAKWVNADGTPIASVAQPKMPQFVLECDKGSRLEAPLTYGGDHPLTLEAWARPQNNKVGWLINIPETFSLATGKPYTSDDRGYHVNWGVQDNGVRKGGSIQAPSEFTVGKEVHVAAVYDGTAVALFVDGKLQGRKQAGGTMAPGKQDSKVTFGNGMGGGHFFGTLSEVRISKIARYQKDFTPARRFVPDNDTLALYHMDENSGNVLKDSSGNGHDGKIVGAKWVAP